MNDYAIFEADKYFLKNGEYKFDPTKLADAHAFCQKGVRDAMSDNRANPSYFSRIAVSNTFTQEWEIEPYFLLAEEFGYKVFSIIIENRHGGKNEHGVPDESIKKMKDRFQIKLV